MTIHDKQLAAQNTLLAAHQQSGVNGGVSWAQCCMAVQYFAPGTSWEETMRIVLALDPSAATKTNAFGWAPLHNFCHFNPNVTPQTLRLMINLAPAAVPIQSTHLQFITWTVQKRGIGTSSFVIHFICDS